MSSVRQFWLKHYVFKSDSDAVGVCAVCGGIGAFPSMHAGMVWCFCPTGIALRKQHKDAIPSREDYERNRSRLLQAGRKK